MSANEVKIRQLAERGRAASPRARPEAPDPKPANAPEPEPPACACCKRSTAVERGRRGELRFRCGSCRALLDSDGRGGLAVLEPPTEEVWEEIDCGCEVVPGCEQFGAVRLIERRRIV